MNILFNIIIMQCFSRLSLQSFPSLPQCFMSHTEVLRRTAFSDGAKNDVDVEWPESGSAILVFTCPPDYCTWRSLPPIAFRYLRRFEQPSCLSVLSEKGSVSLNCLHFVRCLCTLIDVSQKNKKEWEYLLCDKTKRSEF